MKYFSLIVAGRKGGQRCAINGVSFMLIASLVLVSWLGSFTVFLGIPVLFCAGRLSQSSSLESGIGESCYHKANLNR